MMISDGEAPKDIFVCRIAFFCERLRVIRASWGPWVGFGCWVGFITGCCDSAELSFRGIGVDDPATMTVRFPRGMIQIYINGTRQSDIK